MLPKSSPLTATVTTMTTTPSHLLSIELRKPSQASCASIAEAFGRTLVAWGDAKAAVLQVDVVEPDGLLATSQLLELDAPAIALVFAPPADPAYGPHERPLHEARALVEPAGLLVVATSRSSIHGFALMSTTHSRSSQSTSFSQSSTSTNSAPTLCLVWTLPRNLDFPVSSICVAPGGTHILLGGSEGLTLWNVEEQVQLWACTGEARPPGSFSNSSLLSFSSDGRLAATAAVDSPVVRVWWHTESGETRLMMPRMLGHESSLVRVEFNPRISCPQHSPQCLLTLTCNGHVRIWNETSRFEGFDFFVVVDFVDPSIALISWTHFSIDYEGLLWPPVSSPFSNSNHALDRRKSKRWGAMEGGHGHFSHTDAVFDDFIFRAGPYPTPEDVVRDWIVALSPGTGTLSVWALESLGQPREVRIEMWHQVAFDPAVLERGPSSLISPTSVPLDPSLQRQTQTESSSSLRQKLQNWSLMWAQNRVQLPAAELGHKLVPHPNALWADHPPRNLRTIWISDGRLVSATLDRAPQTSVVGSAHLQTVDFLASPSADLCLGSSSRRELAIETCTLAALQADGRVSVFEYEPSRARCWDPMRRVFSGSEWLPAPSLKPLVEIVDIFVPQRGMVWGLSNDFTVSAWKRTGSSTSRRDDVLTREPSPSGLAARAAHFEVRSFTFSSSPSSSYETSSPTTTATISSTTSASDPPLPSLSLNADPSFSPALTETSQPFIKNTIKFFPEILYGTRRLCLVMGSESIGVLRVNEDEEEEGWPLLLIPQTRPHSLPSGQTLTSCTGIAKATWILGTSKGGLIFAQVNEPNEQISFSDFLQPCLDTSSVKLLRNASPMVAESEKFVLALFAPSNSVVGLTLQRQIGDRWRVKRVEPIFGPGSLSKLSGIPNSWCCMDLAVYEFHGTGCQALAVVFHTTSTDQNMVGEWLFANTPTSSLLGPLVVLSSLPNSNGHLDSKSRQTDEARILFLTHGRFVVVDPSGSLYVMSGWLEAPFSSSLRSGAASANPDLAPDPPMSHVAGAVQSFGMPLPEYHPNVILERLRLGDADSAATSILHILEGIGRHNMSSESARFLLSNSNVNNNGSEQEDEPNNFDRQNDDKEQDEDNADEDQVPASRTVPREVVLPPMAPFKFAAPSPVPSPPAPHSSSTPIHHTSTDDIFSQWDAPCPSLHQSHSQVQSQSAAAGVVVQPVTVTVPEDAESTLEQAVISELTSADHLQLLAAVGSFRRVSKCGAGTAGMDEGGTRFVLACQLYRVAQKTLPPRDRPTSLRTCDVAWAVYSDADDALIRLLFTEEQPALWSEAKALGVGLWLRNKDALRSFAETLARTHFLKANKDPFRCLLFYVAVGKPRVVAALFRSAQMPKVADLLSSDFTQERWKQAALKNAYAALSKLKFEEAVSFFLLGDRLSDAARVCVRNMGDYQLALFLARVVEGGETGPVFRDVAQGTVLPIALASGDPWLESAVYDFLGRAEESVQCFFEAREFDQVIADKEVRDNREWFVELAEKSVPQRSEFDPTEASFLKYRISVAPFWGRTKFDLGSSERRAAAFYLQARMPSLCLTFAGDSQSLRSQAAVREASALALRGFSSREHFEALANAAGVELQALLDVAGEACDGLSSACGVAICGAAANRPEVLVREVEACVWRVAGLVGSVPFVNADDLNGGGGDASISAASRLASLAGVCNKLATLTETSLGFGMPSPTKAGLVAANVKGALRRARDKACLAARLALGTALAMALPRLSGALERVLLALDTEPCPLDEVLTKVALKWDVESRMSIDRFGIGARKGGKPTGNFGGLESAGEGWVFDLARCVMRILAMERFQASTELLCEIDPHWEVLSAEFCAAAKRARLAAQHVRGRPPEGGGAAVLEPLRPFMGSFKAPFPSLEEQSLWSFLAGPERIQQLASEVTAASRQRWMLSPPPSSSSQTVGTENRTGNGISPSRPGSTGPSRVGGNDEHDSSMILKRRLLAVTLYQLRNGDRVNAVVACAAAPEYILLASDQGIRDINADSSLRFRERSPDGRTPLDMESPDWVNAYQRFVSMEAAHVGLTSRPGSWESLIESGALAAAVTNSAPSGGGGGVEVYRRDPSAALLALQPGRAQQIGDATRFLPLGQRRIASALKYGVRLQEKINHDAPTTLRLASHPYLPYYVSGSKDGTALLWSVGEPFAVAAFARPSQANWRVATPVTRLRVSPDGSRVMAADASGCVVAWQLAVGSDPLLPYAGLVCHNKAITDCAFLNAGTVLATSSADATVGIWDTLLPPRSCRVMTLFAPGSSPSVATDVPSSIPASYGLTALHYLASDQRLVIGGAAGGLWMYDIRGGKLAWGAVDAHTKAIVGIELDPTTGTMLATGSSDGQVKLWQHSPFSGGGLVNTAHLVGLHVDKPSVVGLHVVTPGSGKSSSSGLPLSSNSSVVPAYTGVASIAFSPNGALLSCGVDGSVKAVVP